MIRRRDNAATLWRAGKRDHTSREASGLRAALAEGAGLLSNALSLPPSPACGSSLIRASRASFRDVADPRTGGIARSVRQHGRDDGVPGWPEQQMPGLLHQQEPCVPYLTWQSCESAGSPKVSRQSSPLLIVTISTRSASGTDPANTRHNLPPINGYARSGP